MRFIGIQSSGKNTLVDSLCALLYKPYYAISCSSEITKEHIEGADTLSYEVIQEDPKAIVEEIINKLETETKAPLTADTKAMMLIEAQSIGKKQLVQTIEFCEEAIVKAMRYGCFVLFDEINLALSAVLGRYHSALDNRKEIVLPRIGLLKARSGFAAIATMNPIGYIGTREMNQALESRFTLTFELKAPTEIKSILKKNCPNSKDEDIAYVDNFYRKVRTLVLNEEISDAFLAIRNYENALLNMGFGTLKKSLLRHVCMVSANDMDSVTVMKDTLDAIFG
jgi:MoxR-like ATPase